MPRERTERSSGNGPHAFWSGSIAFGLVSVPVNLYVASRGRALSLRMVDDDGQPLVRRYVCSADQQSLEREDIVRGYEVEKDRYVIVDDEELERLAPEQSREIQLERFVPLTDIDPIYFERAYFLAPSEHGARAYTLLARVMEEEERAGIASFVMRGKQYPVAILAEKGVLRAETLRFADELRTPEQIGLPALAEPDAKRLERIEREMTALTMDSFDPALLADVEATRIREIAARKRDEGLDVVAAPELLEGEEEEEGGQIVDLMKILKERLEQGDGEQPQSRRTAVGSLTELSRADLYERAQRRGIPGRSKMSREELLAALEDSDGDAPRKGPRKERGRKVSETSPARKRRHGGR